jgi:diaminopimelate decarboxylase
MNFLPEVFSNNSAMVGGELVIGGCRASALAKEFGTPLFVIDEADFKSRIMGWKNALNSNFGESAGEVYYASKSFISVEVAKWIVEAGIGIDVCTGGELAVALAANFPADRIEVHGNNKSEEEIRVAIEVGVAKIVVDSMQEIERVDRLAKAANKVQKVLLRITPGVEAHTHEAISTAHEDVKFGFSIASGAAWKAIVATQDAVNLSLEGLHCHIGSQIFENEGFILATTRLLELSAKFRDEFKVELSELDLGGGYGIAYLAGDKTFDPNQVMAALAELVKKECNRHNLKVPKISIEPGRAVAGPTTTTLYEVGTTKDVELDGGKTRRYIAVDGGMSDNIRPGLYGAKYSALLANRTSSATEINSRLVGKHCESGDIIIRDIDLPSDIGPGDILAIPATGAYGRSMASNYNHMMKPPVISVANGTARTILRRETEADLLALDVVEAPRTIK